MSFNRSRSPDESLRILQGIASRCSELGGPLSKELYQLVKEKDFTKILGYSIKYDSYELYQWEDLMYARQILALYQKNPCLPLAIDREGVAYEKFIAAEKQCFETNKRFKPGFAHKGHFASIMLMAQRKISRILGPLPSLEMLNPAFGPGAATNVIGAKACAKSKLSAPLACSRDMLPWLGEFLSETPLWALHHAVRESDDSWIVDASVHHGKLVFVPKNAKTDRSIVVEPLLNSFWQKAYGSWMKERLRSHGCDLFSQAHNRRLAYEGSVSGELATIDLSSASDTIARNIIWELLPYDWAEALSRLRTSQVIYKRARTGSSVRSGDSDTPITFELEKFSSMGNGYTFELESLIFYALTVSTCKYLVDMLPEKFSGIAALEVSVFGDDILLPAAAYANVCEVLEYFGFSVNQEKSYAGGPFRESCGADFFRGIDIRPFYQKTLVSDRTLFTMHNFFIRNGERDLAKVVESFVTPSVRIYGPDGFGDGHLIGSFELRQPRRISRAGWGGGYFDTYVSRAKRLPGPMLGSWLLPSYTVYTRASELDPFDPDVVRGSAGYARVSIYTLRTSIF